MRYIFYFSFLLILSITGCKNTIVVDPPSIQSTGKVSFFIDRINAPSDVVYVKATLTRANHDPLTSALSLLSDTSASVTIENVLSGTWHLKVDALDSTETVKYTGETDVNVVANTTTNVNLVLNQLPGNTGSISIFVSWGTAPDWIDYYNNPIVVSENNYYDNQGVWMPIVMKDGNKYKMWYGGLVNGSVNYGLYAESNDGLSWTKPFPNPIIYPGSPGNWDSQTIRPGAVIKEGTTYKMYYTSWTHYTLPWHIGMAVSNDGINWTKHPTPVLYGASGWEYQVMVSSVVKHNNIYYMYYSGKQQSDYIYRIGVATSSDGVTWTRHSGNPILIPSAPWEGNTIWGASVLVIGEQFKMVYTASTNNYLGSSFGSAYSNDGLNWTKELNNPFFTRGKTVNLWAERDIVFPNYVIIDNKELIYYSGSKLSSPEDFKIGVIRKQ